MGGRRKTIDLLFLTAFVMLIAFTRYGDFSFCLFSLLGMLKCLAEFIVWLPGKAC